MPGVLSIDELKNELSADYSVEVNVDSKRKREENIEQFLEIDRTGLEFSKLEKRLNMYSTLMGEKICIQYPGKESTKKPKMPFDFRPKLIMHDGTVMPDASFGLIWDLIEGIAIRHKDYLNLVATVFWYIGYMYGYAKTKEEYEFDWVKNDRRRSEQEVIVPGEKLEVEWWHINLDDSVWDSLNNYIGPIAIDETHNISFEALMKFVDLLLQNEDCKYYYKKKILGKKEYKLENGRTNTADANLAIIMYFEKKCSFSEIANKIQQGKGMPRFAKQNYHIVTDGIISNVV